MEETSVQKITSAKNLGNTNVVEEKVVTDYEPDPNEFSIAKLSQVVLYLAHFIAIILTLRFSSFRKERNAFDNNESQ